ncbi:hypothetical protein HRbin32_01017 [bacterium HR32]|nr:hypothetical protein HRbin32_01017 [bacterium HR32]
MFGHEPQPVRQAPEVRQRLRHGLHAGARGPRRRARGQGVVHRVLPRHLQLGGGQHPFVLQTDPPGFQPRPFAGVAAEGHHAGPYAVQQRRHHRVVHVAHRHVLGTLVQEDPGLALHVRLEGAVVVQVVGLQVGQDAHLGAAAEAEELAVADLQDEPVLGPQQVQEVHRGGVGAVVPAGVRPQPRRLQHAVHQGDHGELAVGARDPHHGTGGQAQDELCEAASREALVHQVPQGRVLGLAEPRLGQEDHLRGLHALQVAVPPPHGLCEPPADPRRTRLRVHPRVRPLEHLGKRLGSLQVVARGADPLRPQELRHRRPLGAADAQHVDLSAPQGRQGGVLQPGQLRRPLRHRLRLCLLRHATRPTSSRPRPPGRPRARVSSRSWSRAIPPTRSGGVGGSCAAPDGPRSV